MTVLSKIHIVINKWSNHVYFASHDGYRCQQWIDENEDEYNKEIKEIVIED